MCKTTSLVVSRWSITSLLIVTQAVTVMQALTGSLHASIVSRAAGLWAAPTCKYQPAVRLCASQARRADLHQHDTASVRHGVTRHTCRYDYGAVAVDAPSACLREACQRRIEARSMDGITFASCLLGYASQAAHPESPRAGAQRRGWPPPATWAAARSRARAAGPRCTAPAASSRARCPGPRP